MAKKYNVIAEKKDCILIVCPASHDQQGRKLKATFDYFGKHIKGIFLADTLDCHNCGSRWKAYMQGSEWINRHYDIINHLPIRRWESLRNDPKFNERIEKIHQLYAESEIARQAINNICHNHTKVIVERSTKELNYDKIHEQSVNYMLEEIAGLSMIRDITSLPEAYSGEYFDNPLIFDRLSSDVSLRLPSVIPVIFERRNAPQHEHKLKYGS